MKRDPTLIAYSLLTVLALWAVADCFAPFRGPEAGCRVGYVYDGDTVEMLCGTDKLTARLVGFDTPEAKAAKCPQEAKLAKQATERLRVLVKSGPVQMYRQGHDKYGRNLVVLTVAGRDVAEALVAEGLAHPYHGGQRGGWCD